MKRINQNKKRQTSVSTRPRRQAQPQKKYILESKKSDPKLRNNDITDSKKADKKLKESNEINMDSQSNMMNSTPANSIKVSPQIIRTTFDSINVYLENMKAFYINQAEKLNATVKQLDQKVEFVISKK